MADYTIIADVSAYIVRTLREKMCPEPVPSPNNIEISSPASQDVDYIIGLYLYDIKEENLMSQPEMIRKGRVQLTRPPKPYSLYYMVFINGSSQMGLKAPDIQKIIGNFRYKPEGKLRPCTCPALLRQLQHRLHLHIGKPAAAHLESRLLHQPPLHGKGL